MVVESYVFIGRTLGVNCEQMMEFASKIEKDKPGEIGLPLLKNDITTFELALKYGIHSSNMQSGLVTCSLGISEILTIEVTRRNWVASNNDLPQLHSKIGNGK